MLGVNMSNIESAGVYPRPKAGGYVIKITSAVNNKQNERIDIEFDFAEGDFKDYYRDMQERFKFWGGKFAKSYKAKALPFLKSFIEAVHALLHDGTARPVLVEPAEYHPLARVVGGGADGARPVGLAFKAPGVPLAEGVVGPVPAVFLE